MRLVGTHGLTNSCFWSQTHLRNRVARIGANSALIYIEAESVVVESEALVAHTAETAHVIFAFCIVITAAICANCTFINIVTFITDAFESMFTLTNERARNVNTVGVVWAIRGAHATLIYVAASSLSIPIESL